MVRGDPIGCGRFLSSSICTFVSFPCSVLPNIIHFELKKSKIFPKKSKIKTQKIVRAAVRSDPHSPGCWGLGALGTGCWVLGTQVLGAQGSNSGVLVSKLWV